MILEIAQKICGGCKKQNGEPHIERCKRCKGFVCGERKRDGSRWYGITKDLLAKAVLEVSDGITPPVLENRKPRGGVIEKRYGNAIRVLCTEGRNQRYIARTLGIAINSVRAVLAGV
jgi:hypothetical protein